MSNLDDQINQIEAGFRSLDKRETTLNALAILSTERKTRKLALDLLAAVARQFDETEREKATARADEILRAAKQ